MIFNIFLLKSTLLLNNGLDVDFYKEINLLSVKRIYVILDISREEMIYWGVI